MPLLIDTIQGPIALLVPGFITRNRIIVVQCEGIGFDKPWCLARSF